MPVCFPSGLCLHWDLSTGSKVTTTNRTLSLESNYIDLDCSAPTNSPDVSVADSLHLDSNGTLWDPHYTDSDWSHDALVHPPQWSAAINIMTPGEDLPFSKNSFPGYFANATNLEVNQTRLLFQRPRTPQWSRVVDSHDNFTVVSCNLSQIYVESKITCSIDSKTEGAQNCTVTAQRLGQLLNTYLLGSQISYVVAGGQNMTGVNAITEWGPQGDPLSQRSDGFVVVDTTGRNATASLTQLHEVYVCAWGWLAVLILASSTMLTASLLATWWQIQTRIPDVLGYCSSLTRDAPYLRLQGGNTLDGMERTRMLKDYRVMLGVVEGSTDDGVGHIAVAPAGRAKRPVKGKLYV